jgi:flagellar hook protein FlgE
MFNSIYIGYSGLLGFSKGLDALSHNVSNLNTPGFKSSELIFRDLLYRQSVGSGTDGARVETGGGVDTPASRVKFRQGELRDTGNTLDAAIDGNGFFVLQKDGQTFYTRAGQFEFNSDGYLSDKGTGARVLGTVGEGLYIGDLRTVPPQATTNVSFMGNLDRGALATAPTTVNQAVLDSVGGSHTLSFVFTNNDTNIPGNWLVDVRDAANNTLFSSSITFDLGGAPLAGANTITFPFGPGGIPTTNITLTFGDPGSTANTTNFSGGTTISVRTRDGRPAGALTKATFNAQGAMVLEYSNGQSDTSQQIALAWFDNLSELSQQGGGLFTAPSDMRPTMGTAGDGLMGQLLSGKIELSNVELTEEFTGMVIIQRGYQASSQVISVANEMIQQLMDLRSRR